MLKFLQPNVNGIMNVVSNSCPRKRIREVSWCNTTLELVSKQANLQIYDNKGKKESVLQNMTVHISKMLSRAYIKNTTSQE